MALRVTPYRNFLRELRAKLRTDTDQEVTSGVLVPIVTVVLITKGLLTFWDHQTAWTCPVIEVTENTLVILNEFAFQMIKDYLAISCSWEDTIWAIIPSTCAIVQGEINETWSHFIIEAGFACVALWGVYAVSPLLAIFSSLLFDILYFLDTCMMPKFPSIERTLTSIQKGLLSPIIWSCKIIANSPLLLALFPGAEGLGLYTSVERQQSFYTSHRKVIIGVATAVVFWCLCVRFLVLAAGDVGVMTIDPSLTRPVSVTGFDQVVSTFLNLMSTWYHETCARHGVEFITAIPFPAYVSTFLLSLVTDGLISALEPANPLHSELLDKSKKLLDEYPSDDE